PRAASDGINDRVWDQLAIVNALPGGEPKPGGSSHYDVQVAPDVEYCRGLGELGAEDGVVRLGFDSSGLDSANHGNSDDMSLVVWIVEQCLFDRVDAVLEHAFTGERQRRKREASFVVLTRLQAVDAIIGEEIDPQVPVAAIDNAGVVGVDLSQPEPVIRTEVRAHAQASMT